jgi:hypothetical protein
MDIFINGKNDGGEYTGSGGSLYYTTSPGYFAQTGHNTRYFNGIIDEVRFYNKSLNQSEVLDLYHQYAFKVPLYIGWNLIGWYHDYETTAHNLSDNITGCLSVSMWNATEQTYHTYIVGGPPVFDFPITKGMGIFVDVDQESIWYGEG